VRLSVLIAGGIGYVLGARAGQERYEQIVAVGRRIAGSQTVQATAGVVQAQLDSIKHQARAAVASKMNAGPSTTAANGSQRP
jgi:hypothetical protein